MKNTFCISFFLTCANAFAQGPAYTCVVNDSSAARGYYFISTAGGSYIHPTLMIVDGAGDLVYYNELTSTMVLDFKLHANGLMSYQTRQKFFLLDSTFTLVDSVNCKNGINTDGHDLQILANGHFLLSGFEWVTEDLSQYHYFNHNGTAGSAIASVKCPVIQELDANKNVVFEWHGVNYFSFDDVDSFWLNSPASVDWAHANSVEMDADGNILLCSRHFNEITKINRTDSSVMWRMGGKRNEFAFINDTVPFYGQHDARRIANGHVTLYDDGYHNTSHGARALEYELDETLKTATLRWSYVYDSSMASRSMGNMQRIANGNTVVDYGNVITNNICFNLVDSLGSNIFKLTFNDASYSYRVFNYPQLPFELHRPVITCFDSLGISYLDAGVGYASYQWSNGVTSQIIPVTVAGTFYVYVPYGSGGFISSEKINVTNINDPCNLLTSVSSTISSDEAVVVSPNPVNDILNIAYLLTETSDVVFSLCDLSGRIISHSEKKNDETGAHTFSFDASSLASGFYFIRINNCAVKFAKN